MASKPTYPAGRYTAAFNGYYSIGMPGPGGMQGQVPYNGQGVVTHAPDGTWVFKSNDGKVTIKSQGTNNKYLTTEIGWWGDGLGGGKSRRNKKSTKSKKRKAGKTIRRRR